MPTYGNSECDFFIAINLFSEECVRHYGVDAEKIKKLFEIYADPTKGAGPLLSLSPTTARSLMAIKRSMQNQFPEFGNHPFFSRVGDVARQHWSLEMSEIFYAINYKVQRNISQGICPPEPSQELLRSLRKASVLNTIFTVWRGKTPQRSSNFEAVLIRVIKDNW